MTTTINFQRDRLGGIDWAHLPASVFSLARFTSSDQIYIVANAQDGPAADGSFHRVTNPLYELAGTYAQFRRVAEAFMADSTD